MPNILLEFTVDVPTTKVYEAITRPEGIKGWWTDTVNLQPEEGSKASFGFGPGSLDFEITKLDENNHIAWKTTQGMPDWSGTRVTFDLEATENGTKVLFGHRDFANEDGSFANTNYNWAYFMLSLKSYLETGTGTPVSSN